jgi:DNA-binding transcriptional MerR regulator
LIDVSITRWTVHDLADRALPYLGALPPPRNGQVRQVPDERTIRYYIALGLLDPPLAMRGRTAIYGPRHLAQIIAIKRMQYVGKSLSEIQETLPTLDTDKLIRMTGVPVSDAPVKRATRGEFWRRPPTPSPRPAPTEAPPPPEPAGDRPHPEPPGELHIELAPGVTLVLSGDAARRLLSQLTPSPEEP